MNYGRISGFQDRISKKKVKNLLNCSFFNWFLVNYDRISGFGDRISEKMWIIFLIVCLKKIIFRIAGFGDQISEKKWIICWIVDFLNDFRWRIAVFQDHGTCRLGDLSSVFVFLDDFSAGKGSVSVELVATLPNCRCYCLALLCGVIVCKHLPSISIIIELSMIYLIFIILQFSIIVLLILLQSINIHFIYYQLS